MRFVSSNLDDMAVFERMETSLARALDSAERLEVYGDREIHVPGWGVLGSADLAVAFRARAERLQAELDRFVAEVIARVEAAASAVAAADGAGGGEVVEDVSGPDEPGEGADGDDAGGESS